jgi:hypothetical protein
MRDLWKALIFLVFDQELRTKVAAAATFRIRTDLPTLCTPPLPDFTKQPDLPALGEIDNLFRAKGLFLGVYTLCEINRWMKVGGDPFVQALQDLGPQMQSIPQGQIPDSAIAEAAGVLVADPKLRFLFQTGNTDLRGNGFQISAGQETGLQTDFATGSPADETAQKLFKLGWDTGSCAARFLTYDGMFHPNL